MRNALSRFGLLGLLAPGLLQAMDSEGNFAIKGGGATTCAQYTQALEAKSNELYLYAGWIDGYLTGVNQLQPETFDIAPWQATELLAQLLGQFCERNRKVQFMFATTQMLQSMFPGRLQTSSELVKMTSGGNTAFLYQSVLQRVQEALAERGYEVTADGAFGPQTENALKGFQRDNKVTVSGLPDQRTLLLLLRDSSFTAPAQTGAPGHAPDSQPPDSE